MRGLTATIAALSGVIGTSSAATAQEVIGKDVGLVRPESIRYHAANDRYLISNLGTPDTPNDGFPAVLSPEGTIAQLQWIAGGQNGVELNDPAGLLIHGDTLYVADANAVRQFDLETGQATGSTPIEGAVRLNDLAVSADGTIYVTNNSGSDETPGAIFTRSEPTAPLPFAERSPDLFRPNGIAVLPDGNIVHGGRSTKLYTRSPDGAIVSEQEHLPIGQFDGIVALKDGSLLVTQPGGSRRLSCAGGRRRAGGGGRKHRDTGGDRPRHAAQSATGPADQRRQHHLRRSQLVDGI